MPTKKKPIKAIRSRRIPKENLEENKKSRTRYQKAMCLIAEQELANGGSRRSAAALMNIHAMTFTSYERKFPEFKAAVERGEEKSYKFWLDMGKKMAQNGNASVWALVMTNRFGWRAKAEVTGADGGPLTVEIVDVSK